MILRQRVIDHMNIHFFDSTINLSLALEQEQALVYFNSCEDSQLISFDFVIIQKRIVMIHSAMEGRFDAQIQIFVYVYKSHLSQNQHRRFRKVFFSCVTIIPKYLLASHQMSLKQSGSDIQKICAVSFDRLNVCRNRFQKKG